MRDDVRGSHAGELQLGELYADDGRFSNILFLAEQLLTAR